ncbi:hypothetical protein NC652_011436 [Populus alba x Populus x berolinensis]|nr:hypothetical protein NC652_011436 [Populus alba x Populus x berolinensis]
MLVLMEDIASHSIHFRGRHRRPIIRNKGLGDNNLKSKFWSLSIHRNPVGILTLEFDDGEISRWTLTILYKLPAYLTFSHMVTTSIYNHILEKLYCDHYGTMNIKRNQSYSYELKFKKQSILNNY